MHGRRKVPTTAEIDQLRKEKEAHKIKDYCALNELILQKKKDGVLDKESFQLTTKMARTNPDMYTAWNLRRDILKRDFAQLSKEEIQEICVNELSLLEEVIRTTPKSYWVWNHRRWVLHTMPEPNWKRELHLVGKMLDLDSRNFHGWSYRRSVVAELRKISPNEEIDATEFAYTTSKINQSFSNGSAWHYRSKLLPSVLLQTPANQRSALLENEYELVKAAFYTDPEDQSAWIYHRWLIGKSWNPGTTSENSQHTHGEKISTSNVIESIGLDRVKILEREIEAVRELVEIEPECKWPLQTLSYLQNELRITTASDMAEEIREHLTTLQVIDQLRKGRYQDLQDAL
ncbi:geranylgeranyltransferase type II [Basidiobolus meristosporus CBS 931.73]|uniref:Geranylgeranyl transferase type-2 subunit alpha n=1 Tax=Basidiobolus meristosporus CBS 931.73 TaxID=1314790 RepID=A0A1Y1Y1H8_9FUNG|nr:geranylgeranyltransferase type II [Basidiobolus meristosporus CBS 931.73]|eukprot:ORX91828.1 geranylgeranyltransferase type II [Basidiobolus meristosporus CBS 931.73]